MSGPGDTQNRVDDKAERRAAREQIAAYHQTQLRGLLEHVRAGFARLDAGEIDEFELDDLIHHYKRAATELWKFCGSTGGQWLQAARALRYRRDQGDEPDWWEAGASRRSRSSDSGGAQSTRAASLARKRRILSEVRTRSPDTMVQLRSWALRSLVNTRQRSALCSRLSYLQASRASRAVRTTCAILSGSLSGPREHSDVKLT